MRDGNAHKGADRRERHLMPTERIGMIDLVIPVAANLNARVARNREQGDIPMNLIDSSQHQCIAAAGIARPAVNPHEENIAQIGLRAMIKNSSGTNGVRHKIAYAIIDSAYQ